MQRTDSKDQEQPVYRVEDDDKHPDSWENTGDGRWIRHHAVARKNPYVPIASSNGPDLEELLDTRLTERCFPDGHTEQLLDQWRTDVPLEDEVSLWRGKTIFYVKGSKHSLAGPECLGKPSVDQNHTPTTPKATPFKSTGPTVNKVRKMVEICSFTLMMTAAALASTTIPWTAMTPISIEQGFDLLTETGRNKAEEYLRKEKPDLIVAEWMCDPFSQMQNVNLGKGGLTAERILEKRQKTFKTSELDCTTGTLAEESQWHVAW